MNVKDVMLRNKESKEDKYCMSPLIGGTQSSQTDRDK